ncbi:hypothetical protein KCV03_g427, partial [Aureobasidium melanogenum]
LVQVLFSVPSCRFSSLNGQELSVGGEDVVMSRNELGVSKGEWMCSISTNLVIGTDMGLPWVASWAYDAAVLSQSVAFTSNLGGSVLMGGGERNRILNLREIARYNGRKSDVRLLYLYRGLLQEIQSRLFGHISRRLSELRRDHSTPGRPVVPVILTGLSSMSDVPERCHHLTTYCSDVRHSWLMSVRS